MTYQVTFCVLCVAVLFCVPIQGGISNSLTNTVCQRANSGCRCATESGGLTVTCSGRQEPAFPLDLPSQATKITLQNYQVPNLTQSDLYGAVNLRELNILNCQIQTIRNSALYHLYKLQKIDLSGNALSSVGKNVFYHLVQLSVVDLSFNRISYIAGEAFYSLHNLKILNLEGNPLHCNCEMKRFKDWAFLRTGQVTLLEAKCANKKNLPLFDITDFGLCTDSTLFRSHSCNLCSGAFSHNDCVSQTCTTKQTCFSQIDFSTSKVFINKGCTTDQDCAHREKQNIHSCYNGEGARTCYFCCLGDKCNDAKRGRRTKEVHFYIPVTMVEPADPYLSQDYNNTVEASLNNMRYKVLSNFHSSNCSFSQNDISVQHVGPPQFTIYFNAICTTLKEYKNEEIKNTLESYLKTLSSTSGFRQRLLRTDIFYRDVGICEAEEATNYDIRGIWPATQYGQTAQIYCAENLLAKRLCTVNGWDAEPLCPITLGQTSTTSTTRTTVTTSPTTTVPTTTLPSLEELSTLTVDDNSADQIAEQLYKQTEDASRFTDRDINMTVSLLEDLEKLQSTFTAEQREKNIVGVISHLLNAADSQFSLAEREFKSASRLLSSIQTLSTSTSLAKGDFKEIGSNVGIIATPTNKANFNGIVLATSAHPSSDLDDSNLILRKDGNIPRNSSSWIHLPSQLMSELPVSSQPSRVTLAAFKNDRLFRAIRSTSKADPDDDDDIILKRQSNSIILSAQIPSVEVDGLGTPIEMRFQQNIKTAENATCGYFIETGPNKGHWSSKGCVVKDHVRGEYTECQCDHLTNFALLMDVYGVGGDISEANRIALTYLSYLGCGISLLGLILTLITYFMFRKLRSHNPAKILINLCIAISATDLIFLAGQQEYALNSVVGCKIVAALLHFFLLSAMCWMLVEAYYMYIALIQVFNSYISYFLLKSVTVGWGIPLVIVAITLGVNTTDNYGNQRGGICWLNPIPFYASFLAPVALIIIINFIVFIMVLRQLMGAATKNIDKSDRSKTSSRLRGAVTLVIMLGLTWVFAILAIDGGAPVFQYLFTIFNSLQGLFIFVFHCLLKTDAQKAWKRTCCAGDKDLDSKTSKGYSSNGQDMSKSTVSFSDIKTDIKQREKSTNGVSGKYRV
ncbi:adhesion G-protein coupled receptor G2-like isoform X2 [Ostrea edulis]|uniref:adhesion G-protein coupled receptor G2-like isoform X2 n=1 Tax=Ostrea edulis TaxID=37623 RepID=UPI0024AF2CE1|nr:adhesion G-protein coupled receptor G2-like isoform X2 [Ostrea edulis]